MTPQEAYDKIKALPTWVEHSNGLFLQNLLSPLSASIGSMGTYKALAVEFGDRNQYLFDTHLDAFVAAQTAQAKLLFPDHAQEN